MNGCPPFEQLNALTDGELGSEGERDARRHLGLCANCADIVDAIVALKQVVGRAYENFVPPPALRRAVGTQSRRRACRGHWCVAAIAPMLLSVVGAAAF
jgi:anti-sigma factor RsiW